MPGFASPSVGAAFGRLFLRYTLLACLALAGAFWLSNYLEARFKTAGLAQEETQRLRLVAQVLKTSLMPVLADVRILAESEPLADYLKAGTVENRARLEDDFFVVARHQPSYAQLRYIDRDGTEVVRIERTNGFPFHVPFAELQAQGSGDAARQLPALTPGELFIAPLDSSRAGSAEQAPPRPILRIATPVKDEAGGLRGLVIIHYQAAPLLSVFAEAMAESWGRPMLLDQDGFWLYNPDSKDTRRFGLDGGRFQDRFPQAWSRIHSAKAGQIATPRGLFIFRSFVPDPGTLPGEVEAAPNPPKHRIWHLVSYVPDPRLWPYLLRSMAGDLPTLGLFILVAVLAGGLLAWARSQELTSEERFRRLVELQPDAVLVTREGRCVYANPAGLDLLGVGALAAIRDKPVLDLIAAPFQDSVRHWIEQAQGGQSVAYQEPDIERGDGTRIAVEMRATDIYYAGRPGLLIILRDITERRQTERLREALIADIRLELRASEERFRVALKNAPIMVFNQDLALRYQWIDNPVRLSPEQLLGKTDAELLPRREDAERLQALKRRVLEAGSAVRETVTVSLDGVEHSYDLTLEPLRDASDAISGLTGAAFDISERVDLEARLREQARKLVEADRRKNDFLAMLGHELRNPLAPIRSAVDVLKLQPELPADLRWAVEMIDRQLAHITRLVDDLLDVARITRGRIELKKNPLDLAEVIARAVETSRPAIEARRHALTVSLPEPSLWLEADPVRLAQVIANLLHNAAKYTEPGGRIALSVHQEGREAVLRVQDNGIGIAPEMLGSIFDLFTQVEQSLDRAQGGIGLGLTLVRSLVEMHGGRVTASSAGPGRGSEFTVRLPLLADRPPPAVEAAANDARLPARRILIVEDNEPAAAALATLLRSLGHAVQAVGDGETALRMIGAFKPELVFLDIGLPRMDGYEVARRIRRQPGLDGIRLIAVTGYGREQDIRQAQEAGFDRHLLKPISLEQLQDLFVALQEPPPARHDPPRLPAGSVLHG